MKRWLSFLVIACMLFTQLDVTSLAASSSEYTADEETVSVPETAEKAVQDSESELPESEEEAVFIEDSGDSAAETPVLLEGPGNVCEVEGTEYATIAAALAAVTSGGTATITMIADTEESITIGDSKKITLNLAGFTVTGSADQVVMIESGAQFTLTDTVGTGALDGNGTLRGVFNYDTFIMESGSIQNCGEAGVYNYNDKSFTMNGGSIKNCSSGTDLNVGGGVYNCGIFTMNGGSIENCSASYYGGGVYTNDGTFTMNGGSITGCSAGNAGGGVYYRSTF